MLLHRAPAPHATRSDSGPGLASVPGRSFDVICAGEALWNVAGPAGGVPSEASGLRFRPGGGAVNAAFELARQGLRVGLATVLADDRLGRALRARVTAAGIDAGGVELAHQNLGIVFVREGGGARQVVSYREEEQPVAVPEGWSSQVLLLSGMSPVLAHGAALCKAARAARRAGTVVVVDLNARWHLWAGRDPRTIRMVLREADVVWCSAEDLFGLNLDVSTVREALRPSAVLAASDASGRVWARGPFGEVTPPLRGAAPLPPTGEGEAFAAAICAELARAGAPGEASLDLWVRALQRGQDATSARLAGR